MAILNSIKINFCKTQMLYTVDILYLSYDVASESEITPCNKIDYPLVVYSVTGNVMTSITPFAYLMTKLYRFYARNEISNVLNVI